MATSAQVEANRKNGKLGGPKTEAGKAAVRHNARKHGIFASALTVYDAEDVAGLHEEFRQWFEPVGPIESTLVELLALTRLRMQRCAEGEAEQLVKAYEDRALDPIWQQDFIDKKKLGMRANWFCQARFEQYLLVAGRYSTTLNNQFLKLLHELEALQRRRSQTTEASSQQLAVSGQQPKARRSLARRRVSSNGNGDNGPAAQEPCADGAEAAGERAVEQADGTAQNAKAHSEDPAAARGAAVSPPSTEVPPSGTKADDTEHLSPDTSLRNKPNSSEALGEKDLADDLAAEPASAAGGQAVPSAVVPNDGTMADRLDTPLRNKPNPAERLIRQGLEALGLPVPEGYGE